MHLKITCYDKIKLLSLYSNLTHYYSLSAGYQPVWILGYFLQDIEQTIPIDIPYSNQFNLPTLNITSGNALEIAHIDFDDLIALPNPTGGWTYSYHSSGWPGPYWGFRLETAINRISFIFAYKKVLKATYPSPATTKYQGRFRGRIFTFYNNICPVIVEYDERTDWVDDLPSLDNAHNEFISFFAGNGITEAILYSLPSVGVLNGRAYGSSHYVDHWTAAHFTGNLFPSYLQPGKSYETNKEEQTENLKVLKAMLLLYNATVYTNASGTIIFKNKDAYSTAIIEIDDEDVISFMVKRGNPEKPEIASIDVLAGDTTQLQTYIQDYLIDSHDSKWSCEATIDQLNKYSLTLQSKIRIKDQIYALTEVERDYINYEYKVKAWLL